MNTPPDGIVPDGMPPDLERVRAALTDPLEPGPDVLLQRILASRAAGERRILPADHGPKSKVRVTLFRGAVAAALGLAVLGTWSRWGRRNVPPAAANAAAEIGGGFSFGGLAFAQGTGGPKFPPMTFDLSRLRPRTLSYSATAESGNSPTTHDTFTITLARSASPAGDWIVTRVDAVKPGRATEDSLWLNEQNLRPVMWFHINRGPGISMQSLRITIGDSEAKTHREFRSIGRTLDTFFTASDTTNVIVRSKYPATWDYSGNLLVDFMAVPLAPGWRGSTVHPLVPPAGGIATMDFELTGDRIVDTPAGKVDCWVVRQPFHRIASGSWTMELLIRKSDGVTISVQVDETVGKQHATGWMTLIGEQ